MCALDVNIQIGVSSNLDSDECAQKLLWDSIVGRNFGVICFPDVPNLSSKTITCEGLDEENSFVRNLVAILLSHRLEWQWES